MNTFNLLFANFHIIYNYLESECLPQTRLKAKQGVTCHEDKEREVESSVESDSENLDNSETQLQQSLEDLLDRKLTEHMNDLAIKDCIKDMRNTISEQNSKIAVIACINPAVPLGIALYQMFRCS